MFFCGISLENAGLYRDSTEISSQLQSFLQTAFSLTEKEDIKNILTNVIKNCRKVVEAECASLFLVDKAANVLSCFINDGGNIPPTIPLDSGLASYSATSNVPLIVNNCYDDPRFNRNIDSKYGFQTKSVCVVPIISKEGNVLGVAEMVNKTNGNFSENDLNMLKSYAALVGISLINEQLQTIVEIGSVEVEVK